MAALTIPPIESEFGPCPNCEHRDCQQTREMAAARCPLCEESIGYGRRYYDDRDYGLVHASCLEDKINNLLNTRA